jgi:ABC-type nitrate/sulfonate/bicarbonate transport system substrate-binding protein
MGACHALRRMLKDPFRSVCLFLLFALSLAACQKQPGEPVGPREKITIAYPLTIYSVLFQVAFVKGFFLAEGLEVTPQPHHTGRVALKSVIEGKADLAISGDTAVMFAIVGGKRISVIAVGATSKKNEAIVARKDRGINLPVDLRGKHIGVVFGTTGHFFLDSFLSTHRIDRKNVTIIDMKPEDMMDALGRGRVDAVAVWNPVMKQLERRLGGNGVVFYDESIYSDIVCVSASREYTKNHGETIKKILKALLKAEWFVKQYPDDSRRLVAEFMRTDKTVLDEVWHVMDFRVTLDQSLLVALEDETRWARKNRLIDGKEVPNYLEFIYFEGLQSIKPEAVRIIR